MNVPSQRIRARFRHCIANNASLVGIFSSDPVRCWLLPLRHLLLLGLIVTGTDR